MHMIHSMQAFAATRCHSPLDLPEKRNSVSLLSRTVCSRRITSARKAVASCSVRARLPRSSCSCRWAVCRAPRAASACAVRRCCAAPASACCAAALPRASEACCSAWPLVGSMGSSQQPAGKPSRCSVCSSFWLLLYLLGPKTRAGTIQVLPGYCQEPWCQCSPLGWQLQAWQDQALGAQVWGEAPGGEPYLSSSAEVQRSCSSASCACSCSKSCKSAASLSHS